MAYALESLSMILKQVLHPYNQQYLILYNNLQIQSLLERVNFLKNYLMTGIIENLEIRIVIASQRVEDIIEAHMSDRILSSISTHLLDLKDLMEEFDSIIEEIINEFDPPLVLLPYNLNSSLVVSLSPYPDPSSSNILVGMEEEFDFMRFLIITGEESQLEEIAIIGMGGLGKTTLARKLYNNSSITNYFDIRLWIKISIDSNLRDSLLSLLESLRKLTSRMHRESDDELGKHIYKALRGKRYLIVVDGIWQIEEWQLLRRFFPDDGNGSRILLTTRLSSIARYSTFVHHMNLLSEDECWMLFRHKVFAGENCPSELQGIAQKICMLCYGRPLTIIVIAGILLTSKTRHFWEFVAKNIESACVSHDSSIEIINMGYNLLPHYLKPCFLYMGAFREDCEIGASEIIRLWVAEGFIIPIANKTLEETAEDYLRALIHRNLLMVGKNDINGKVKTFSIHGLLRDMAKEFAAKENFLRVSHWGVPNIPKDSVIMCRSEINDDKELIMTLARSSLYFGHFSLYFRRASNTLDPVIFYLRLLRILDVFKIELHQFPMEILQLVNLRYLAFTCRSVLPPSISRFWNLQTLIIGRLPSFRAFSLPSQVWEMTQLRHIKSKKACIWYCPGNAKNIIQEDLQTLTNIQLCGVTNKVLEKFPNLKKLGVFCNVALYDVFDLASLHKLETLKCSSDWSMVTRDFLSYLTFPPSLKKLTLSLCKIPLGFMATVGSLPNLEQLKLQKSDFIGIELEPIEPESEPMEPEWETREGEFPRLISLQMEDLNLVHWTSCGTYFPRLQRLVVRECCSLEKIPYDMGYMPTIEVIEVDESSPSLLASAMEIEALGIQVVVYRS